jgi:hypothetical protein
MSLDANKHKCQGRIRHLLYAAIMDKLHKIKPRANTSYDVTPKSQHLLLKIKGGLFPNYTTTSSLYKITRPVSKVVDSPHEVTAAVHTHFDKELILATPPELPLPPWENPANPNIVEITPRGDPTANLAEMITRDTFDKIVHSLGTGRAPGQDGIPNEIIKILSQTTHSALYCLLSLFTHKSYNPPDWCHSTTCQSDTKSDPILLENYHPLALMKNHLKLWTAIIKDAGSKYGETHGIFCKQQDGVILLRRIHDAQASIIMMMEDANIYNKEIYIMYVDFKGAINATNHRIMFKHTRQLDMSSTFDDTCE